MQVDKIILPGKFIRLDSAEHLFCKVEEWQPVVGLGGTSETSAVNTPAAVSLGGMIYNMELPEGMETKEYFYYWLKKDGELKQFVNFRQLRKFYKSQDDLFDSYVKSHGVRFEHPEEIDQLVAHLESR